MLPLISKPNENKLRTSSLIKSYILAFLLIIVSFAFGLALKSTIYLGDHLWLTTSLGITYLVFFFLVVMLIKGQVESISFMLFASMATLFSFYDKLSLPLIYSSIFLLLCFVWGNFSGKREAHSIFQIRFNRVGKETIVKAILGIAAFASVAFFVNYSEEIKSGNKKLIEQSAFEKLLAPSMPIVKLAFPEFDVSLSADELANKMAEKQVAENPQVKQLPELTQKQVLKTATADFKKQISNFFGGAYDKSSKVSVVFYRYLIQEFSKLSSDAKNLIAIIIALLIFATIMGLGFFIRIITTMFSWIIYQILLATGFCHVASEGRSQEVITLD